MSDFNGMGGALVVCLIAQSIVFLALAFMAGVIRLVGLTAGDKAPVASGTKDPGLQGAVAPSADGGDEAEVAAVIMAALSAGMSGDGKDDLPGPSRPSAWRLVSLQEASRAGGRP
jgi:Na+-transporting methylmalonyl-CoA/oxaloacetate decarboxylase gamma subunit